MTAEHLSEY